jgi:hypothetical protein
MRPQSRQSAKLFTSRWNWDSPNPSLAGECALPRERGWASPNSDEGTYTVVLFVYMCFVPQTFEFSPLNQLQKAALTRAHTFAGFYGGGADTEWWNYETVQKE